MKIKKFFAIIVTLCLFLTGCSNSFNWEKNVSKLEDAGYVVEMLYTSNEDLEHEINSIFALNEKDYTVEVVRYINLQKGDYKNSCVFIQFKTEEQAQNYYDLRVEIRYEDSDLKLALYDDVVLLAKSSEVVELLNLDFNQII